MSSLLLLTQPTRLAALKLILLIKTNTQCMLIDTDLKINVSQCNNITTLN